MIRRILCLLSAVLVCTSSVFAWSAESFVDDGSPYELAPVSSPSVFRASSRAAVSSASSDDGYIHFLENGVKPDSSLISASAYTIQARRPYDATISLPTGFETSYAGFEAFHVDSASLVPYLTGSSPQFRLMSAGVLDAIPENDSYSKYDSAGNYYLTPSSLRLDLHLDGSSSSFELFYNLNLAIQAFTSPSAIYTALASPISCNIYVNGSSYSTVSGGSSGYVGHEIISLSEPITSISFLLEFPNTDPSPATLIDTVDYTVNVYWHFYSQTFIYGQYLTGNSALDGFNDQAQDAINEHESIESQWTGSMTENFNKLDISSFTFPSGLVSGFSLITGIFQDIWNAIGEYRIVYVFPLTLGIVLLLIGRISRFAGRSSSRKSGGDDG